MTPLVLMVALLLEPLVSEQCVGVGIGVVSVEVEWIECHHTDDDGGSTQINNHG